MNKSTAKTPALTVLALNKLLQGQGFSLTEKELDSLAQYLSLLEKWNRVMNLVGPGSWVDITNGLILDSLYLARYLENAGLPAQPLCWDFGSGAGLPGIPLRILWQNGSYHLVEAREKRALFMRTVLSQLKLPDTHVTQARIENFMEKSDPADILISRAFMPWEKLLETMQGRLAKNGKVLIMALEHAPALPKHLAEHWQLKNEFKYSLPIPGINNQRYFWLLSS